MDALLSARNFARTMAAGLTLSAALVSGGLAPGATAQPQAGPAPIQFEALPPQELRDGACGLFLWSYDGDPALVLVAFDRQEEARVRPDGRMRTLSRTEASGQRRAGHSERQVYSDGRLTLQVDVHFDDERSVRGGAFVDRGTIRVTDRDGWETIIPARGMVACQA